MVNSHVSFKIVYHTDCWLLPHSSDVTVFTSRPRPT